LRSTRNKSEKNEHEVCEKIEYHEDGSKTMVFRSTNEKNKIQKSVFKYNKEEKLLEYVASSGKEKIQSKRSFTYDSFGNRTSITYYYKNGTLPERKYVMKYDSKMNKRQQIIFKKKSTTPSKIFAFHYEM